MKTTNDFLLELMVELDSRKSVPVDSVKQKLLVLSTARSGSSMFCDILSKTGEIGECREWFNSRYIKAYEQMKQIGNVTFNEYVDFIISKTIGTTGVFAVNVHIEQYADLVENKINILDLAFDHVIFLQRKDKVSQAVSLTKAMITDSWSSDTKAERDITGHLTNGTILPYYNHIINSERYYQKNLFSQVQAEYSYEDFLQIKETAAYREVLTALGKCSETDGFQTSMKKQADANSKKIIAQFRKYIFG